ncbi:MAG: RNA polymerase sigma factor [Fimbriimonas sp.]|nr:RNA polymerase sigma factor [Fimbriimonas sp.]
MELARGVARNDDACVAAFFQAYHAGVYRYMLCLTNNIEDAEDLAQDSLLRAKAQIRSYRGEAGLKTWVHRVAFHTFTHWNRKRRPRSELSPQLADNGEPFGRIDAAQALLKALTQLGPALAQPLVLQEISELSVDEIAQILEIPTGTVKSRLSTARQRLRQYFGEPS